tara:strand:+ start:381 stop:659 length:279 start_codon:yes stop_codon:yes gene_type:complete
MKDPNQITDDVLVGISNHSMAIAPPNHRIRLRLTADASPPSLQAGQPRIYGELSQAKGGIEDKPMVILVRKRDVWKSRIVPIAYAIKGMTRC